MTTLYKNLYISLHDLVARVLDVITHIRGEHIPHLEDVCLLDGRRGGGRKRVQLYALE